MLRVEKIFRTKKTILKKDIQDVEKILIELLSSALQVKPSHVSPL